MSAQLKELFNKFVHLSPMSEQVQSLHASNEYNPEDPSSSSESELEPEYGSESENSGSDFEEDDTMKSESEKVLQFTEESMGVDCPDEPQLMLKKDVKFITEMILSELMELALTVVDEPELGAFMTKCMRKADRPRNYVRPTDETELIAEQADAFVDINYYAQNAACKKGVNLSKVFEVVHAANMAKKFSDGEFHRRDDGKVIKPPDWQEPDVVKCIAEQKKFGSWS